MQEKIKIVLVKRGMSANQLAKILSNRIVLTR